jgi:hypothetical protein
MEVRDKFFVYYCFFLHKDMANLIVATLFNFPLNFQKKFAFTSTLVSNFAVWEQGQLGFYIMFSLCCVGTGTSWFYIIFLFVGCEFTSHFEHLCAQNYFSATTRFSSPCNCTLTYTCNLS